MKRVGELKGENVSTNVIKDSKVTDEIMRFLKRSSSEGIFNQFVDQYTPDDNKKHYLGEVSFEVTKETNMAQTGLFRKRDTEMERITVDSHANVYVEDSPE